MGKSQRMEKVLSDLALGQPHCPHPRTPNTHSLQQILGHPLQGGRWSRWGGDRQYRARESSAAGLSCAQGQVTQSLLHLGHVRGERSEASPGHSHRRPLLICMDPGGTVYPAQVCPSASRACAGNPKAEPAGRQCSKHREGMSYHPQCPRQSLEPVRCLHWGQAAPPWETGISLTLGDIRLRARASTSWAVATFSVVGGWGSSAGLMSGTSSTLKRGCQRVNWSSGTTMGGFREAKKTYPRKECQMTLDTSAWG